MLSPFSRATVDAAHEWLNNSDRAAEYTSASDERAEEMLLQVCAEIVSSETAEQARIRQLESK